MSLLPETLAQITERMNVPMIQHFLDFIQGFEKWMYRLLT